MALALAHFAVGFVVVLVVASALRRPRYRLTSAYLGGVWALVPDARKLLGGPLGARLGALHDSPRADVFFFHYTLDREVVRAHELEVTALSLAVLGVAVLASDWRSGSGGHRGRVAGAAGPEESS